MFFFVFLHLIRYFCTPEFEIDLMIHVAFATESVL